MVRHEAPGGPRWSQYAHLQTTAVRVGERVTRGHRLGTVGKGAGDRFAAHLHFEVRTAELPADYWPGLDHAKVRRWYMDPLDILGRSL